ncbi:MAG: homoserine dehydrogenase [Flavobacteriales bacterium]
MSKSFNIGLFGFGCVGQGLYHVLANSKGFRSEITKIVVKNRNKKRTLPEHFFSFDKNDILLNPEIDLVVELIDDANEAFEIVSAALSGGKNVVTANKKMIAEHFEELIELQKKYGTALLYEASACGGIPIIRTLEEYYDNESLKSVRGIFNGSSNYILTKIFEENLDYSVALKQAQDLGFAESNPRLDVGGFDAKYKLIILAAHSYGLVSLPEQVLNFGIENLSQTDIQVARKSNFKIKLIAQAAISEKNNVSLSVLPHFIKHENPLSAINNEYNAVVVEAAFSDTQLFIGKGAGSHPTGSAVLSDISANSYNYQYEYKKKRQQAKYNLDNEKELVVYIRTAFAENRLPLPFSSIGFQNSEIVVGKIKIAELILAKKWLETHGAFVAEVGEVLPEIVAYLNQQELEVVAV